MTAHAKYTKISIIHSWQYTCRAIKLIITIISLLSYQFVYFTNKKKSSCFHLTQLMTITVGLPLTQCRVTISRHELQLLMTSELGNSKETMISEYILKMEHIYNSMNIYLNRTSLHKHEYMLKYPCTTTIQFALKLFLAGRKIT